MICKEFRIYPSKTAKTFNMLRRNNIIFIFNNISGIQSICIKPAKKQKKKKMSGWKAVIETELEVTEKNGTRRKGL